MKKNRLTALLMAILTAMSLAGGSALAESADITSVTTTTTATGRVTAVSTESITMELGEWTTPTIPQGGADASSSTTVKPETSAAPETTAAPDVTATPDASVVPNDGAAQANPAQNDQSTTPQDGQGNAPQNDQSAAPQDGQGNVPQNDQPAAPQDGQGNAPQNDQPAAPQDGQGNVPQNDQPAAPQDGQENPQPSQDTQRGSSSFTATGETLTFSITESTAYTFSDRRMNGSLSDITIGAILTVTLTGDAATSIAILETAGTGGRGFFGNRGARGDRFNDNMPGGNRGGNRQSGGFGWNNRGAQGGDKGTRGWNPGNNGPQNSGNGNCPQCNPGQNGGTNNQASGMNG